MARRAVFTIVMPTWNRADLLQRALKSVLEQTLSDIEVFISDNGSTDHTCEVVQSFNDPRVVYRPTPTNLGLHANLNRCLRFGTAPYLAYLHDDDWYHPTNLERKAEFLDAHPSVGAVHSPVDRADASGRIYRRGVVFGGVKPAAVEQGHDFIERSMKKMGLTDFSSTALRRTSIRNHRFLPEDGLPCDVGFRLRMALTSDVGFIDESLTVQSKHETSQSRRGGVEVESDPGEGAPSIAHIQELILVKQRFLAAHQYQVKDPERLAVLARDAARRQLYNVLRRTVYEGEDWPSVFRTLAEVAATDPRMISSETGLRAVGLAAIGPVRDSVRAATRRRE